MILHLSEKTKKIFLFIGGMLSGVILLIAISYIKAYDNGSGNMYLFETPGQVIRASDFQVIQVFEDGSALASVESIESLGTVVLFPAPYSFSYYDEQKIHIPDDKVLKQIGTYRYFNRQNIEKTVPIVKEFEK